MSLGNQRTSALKNISDRCARIMSVCSDRMCKHPMRCCCCHRWTELDLPTGIRVLRSSGKMHYVCTNLLPLINEHNKLGKYKNMYPMFMKVLTDLNEIINT